MATLLTTFGKRVQETSTPAFWRTLTSTSISLAAHDTSFADHQFITMKVRCSLDRPNCFVASYRASRKSYSCGVSECIQSACRCCNGKVLLRTKRRRRKSQLFTSARDVESRRCPSTDLAQSRLCFEQSNQGRWARIPPPPLHL